MRLNEYQIVIEPREIVFEHIEPGRPFRKTLNIKNVGNKSKRMELFRPGNKVFQLTFTNPELPVPPGMEIAAVVEFQSNNIQDYADKMVVCIDDKEIPIPIRAFPAKPILDVEAVVDFGLLSVSKKTVSKKFRIRNVGALDGHFTMCYRGDLALTFSPHQDVIPPYSEIFVRADLFTNKSGKIDEKVQITLEGVKDVAEFRVKANLVKKELVLLDGKSHQPIQKLNFGSCYYGCNLLSMAILYNSSPEKVDYVILLEEKGVGTEIGAELSKSTITLKAKTDEYKEEDFSPVNKLISAFPNNGSLEPFEKRPIFFRFSPQYKYPDVGFMTTLVSPPRRDYAIFLYFEMLGTQLRTEVAITGTALPVLLRIDPNQMNFNSCELGQRKDFAAVLHNDSELKDVRFKFVKVANYTVQPASGRIQPRSSKNVVISFVPHQMGTLNYTLFCEVIDKAADQNNPLVEFDKGIFKIPIELRGNGVALSVIPPAKFSGGMMPLITNEVGLNVNSTFADLKSFVPKAIVQNAVHDGLHKNPHVEQVRPENASEFKVAFPNDRAKSIAPFNRSEKYKTLFTGVDRHNYVDIDYAYTNEERARIEAHKAAYKQYLDNLRFYREEKTRTKEHKAFNNSLEVGMVPGGGVKPQYLEVQEIYKEAAKPANFQINEKWQLISSEELLNQEKLLKKSTSNNNLTLANISHRDRDRIRTQLTPAQIYKIIVSPSVVDFGEVSINSLSVKTLDFLNTLDQPIMVEIENDCPELAQSSPLSQIIQPQAKGTFTLAFESDYVQTFQRSITYRINYSYRHHLIILADCKLPSVKLNKNHLVLTQLTGVQADLCYRSNVTVINPFNTMVEFTWVPIYGEQGTAFSVRPAAGVIEPHQELECEVVWHGSSLAPNKGTFSLQVTGGEATSLTCEAKIGSSQIQFINRRANFGKIPVNMKSTRTFHLTNTGTHNAYFQILDNMPVPGMVITPMFGIAPVNAVTPIRIEMNPVETMKFDAKVLIQVRGGRQLELRLSGESEEPLIDFDLPNFDFGGIYTGASCALPFKLSNKSQVKGKVEFDLKKYPDFSVRPKDKSIPIAINDKRYEITLSGGQTIEMEFVFTPSGVASYDFDLPITVNKREQLELLDEYDNMISNTPYMSSMQASALRDKRYQSPTRKSSRSSVLATTPKKKVTAVGLRKALELSTSCLWFKVPITYYEKLKEGGFCEVKSVVMTNRSHRAVKWCLDMRNPSKVLDDGKFKICDGSMIPFVNTDKKSIGPEGEIGPNESYEIKVLFCPDKPGIYSCNLPIVVNQNYDHPYYNVEINGELMTPEIFFDPDVLVFKPVPLGLETTELLTIKQKGYETKSKLRLVIPEAKTLEGESIQVLKADFVNDPVILPDENHRIEINLKFSSSKPISTTIRLKFIDEQNREYEFSTIVTADNSLFTCYSFLADNHNAYHIVSDQSSQVRGGNHVASTSLFGDAFGDPILRPYSGTSHLSRNGVTPTFDVHDAMDDGLKEVDENGFNQANRSMSRFESRMSTAFIKALDPLLFPSVETNSGLYTNQVLRALERWYKCNGWPTSHNLVKIPESFRAGVSRKPLEDNEESMPQQDAMKRETKTIYEMITHLSGRQLPAIPQLAPIPNDLAERTFQFHWQHNVLLKFLEAGGGCIAGIKAEYLLDTGEFRTYIDQINRKKSQEETSSGFKNTQNECIDAPRVSLTIFPLVSKKAWLDCLLQALKVFIFNRITPKSFKSMPVPYDKEATFPDVKSDPLTSNIYSTGERILLAWLNYCYSSYKDKIWPGRSTPSKWIVNFDIDLTDSLALAVVIGTYCPYIIDSHLSRMYLSADTAEKCFHNALILVDCCRELGFDYDLTSLDITDPNAIGMALFVAYIFNKLPNYIPCSSIEFNGPLHTTVPKQVKITNPISKNIFYEALIIGPNKESFSFPKGKELAVSSRGRANLAVDYYSDNLKPAYAHLILVGKKNASVAAEPLVFNLKANVNELTAKKIIKFQSGLYKQTESRLEIENPYDQAGHFSIKVLETGEKSDSISNPFSTSSNANTTKQNLVSNSNVINAVSNANTNKGGKAANGKMKALFGRKESIVTEEPVDLSTPILSAFYTKQESIYLEAKGKAVITVSYLPLQSVKHGAVLLFTNEKLGEFVYHLEGTAAQPEPIKVQVDEGALDPNKIKYIKSSRFDDKTLTFRCFMGDKIDICLLVPVCNQERENAVTKAAEQRMSELELKRRRVHGVLSSKSLLEALDLLTVNKSKINNSTNSKSSLTGKTKTSNLTFTVAVKNSMFIQTPSSLTIDSESLKSDENTIPLRIKFNADRTGYFQSFIELKSLPDDIRIIPVDFKITDNFVSDNTSPSLQFTSCVFDPIVQPIPIKNNSEMAVNYEAEIIGKVNDKNAFKGPTKFTIQAKDIYSYELVFLPNAEEKFEAELVLNNLTEGIISKYVLTGVGEKKPALGEIKLDTRVGQVTQHEIQIPNKSNKKICFYVSSNSPFIQGPDKIMLLPNRKETYKFEICPTQRGEFKGAITFNPGEWPIKDVDSDGEEMAKMFNDEKPPQFTLWFTFDLKVNPAAKQSTIELEAHVLDSGTVCIPLSNPLNKSLEFQVTKTGQYLDGAEKFTIAPKEKFNYELKFCPKRVGKFKGSLVFLNNETGEFWYELRLVAVDALPFSLDPIEAELGRFGVKTISLKNPLNEALEFRVIVSNTDNFNVESNQLTNDTISVDANGSVDVNIKFNPSTIGPADHVGLISFFNERIGNLTYEVSGIGLEPDTQDPINITAEVNHSQMVTVYFRNTTDSAIYCDMSLLDDTTDKPFEESDPDSPIFNILMNNVASVHVPPRGSLDIPIVFKPNELRSYSVNLVVSARREARMSWNEKDPNRKLDRLQWIYPIKAFSVINAINKSTPFQIECSVRKRLEKRMEIVLSNVSSYYTSSDRRSPLRVRSVTPYKASATPESIDSPKSKNSDQESAANANNTTLAQEFTYNIQFFGNSDQCQTAGNSIAIKLVRTQRDKTNGLVTLIFDLIFCPSKSFIVDAFLQIETIAGGMWRYPIKLYAIEPPADDLIIIEGNRLNRESLVGFRLYSGASEPLKFRAQLIQPNDQIFSVSPQFGELMPESEDGTLFKVGFTPLTYGKSYQAQLIISTPTHQWKYVVKGVTPEYVIPRGQSGIPRPKLDPRVKQYGKKRNYVVENTYIIHTGVSSPIKGASLMQMRYANMI